MAKVLCPPGIKPPGNNGVACDAVNEMNYSCQTQLLIKTNQTVSFYVKKEDRRYEFGTGLVGKTLQDDRCFDHDEIIAVTWDENAKIHRSKSIIRYNNINQRIFVQYPDDFSKPFVPETPVLCQTEIFNETNALADFYDKRANATSFLMRLYPYQRMLTPTPCYQNQSIIAISAGPILGRLDTITYESNNTYSNVNQFAFAEFTKDFSEASSYLMHLFKREEYNLLVDAAREAAAHPKLTYKAAVKQKNDDPTLKQDYQAAESEQANHNDSSQNSMEAAGKWVVQSGVESQ